ncbi:MAG: acetoin utilization protein AcuC [Thermoplasmata archaeon]|nr:acetoin utilization protein AcuC [Thermoplasmata archaeon]
MPNVSGGYVWDERFLQYDFGRSHPFTQRSRRSAVRLLEAVLASEGRPSIEHTAEVPVATDEYLESFHQPEYLEFVRRAGRRDGPGYLDRGDTPSFPGCFEASARIAAGASWAFETTHRLNRPTFHPAGGLHHAHPARASGFCVFNDLALAMVAASRSGQKIAYIDIDAHHGDGVMYGLYDSGSVLDIDFHQDGRTLFPGTGFPSEIGEGEGSGLKVNVPIPPGGGDETLLPLFRRLVPPLVRSFRPDLLVLQHGADGHAGDPLARLAYTSKSYDEIDRVVLDLGKELCQSRVVFAGGGGYRPESVVRVFARAGLAALGVELPLGEHPLPGGWRREFEAEWGRPAPSTWIDPEPAGALSRPPPSDYSDELVRELERSLGQPFPRDRDD